MAHVSMWLLVPLCLFAVVGVLGSIITLITYWEDLCQRLVDADSKYKIKSLREDLEKKENELEEVQVELTKARDELEKARKQPYRAATNKFTN